MRVPYRTGTVRITSPYGHRILNGVPQWHGGIDFSGTDKRLTAAAGGTVLRSRMVTDRSDRTWEWGNYVSVAGDDGMVIYYCHMAERLVKAGDRVEAGGIIGIEGNTGYSFGSHCHFEVRDSMGETVDPAVYLGLPVQETDGIPADRVWCEYFGRLVCGNAGLEEQTRAYLDAYRYAPDLWRKLWYAMNNR